MLLGVAKNALPHPKGQGKHSNAAVCGFHTAPLSLMPPEEYPPERGGGVKMPKKKHLWLTFEREGGGSNGSSFKTAEKSTSSSHLDARKVVTGGGARHGGSSGSGIETIEKSTSSSCLDAREIGEKWWCRCGFGCHWGFGCRCIFAFSFHSGGEVTTVGMGG